MSRSVRSLALVSAVLLFAALLRIYQIDAQSIWADEGFTYLVTQQTDILPMLRADVHPPLYFLGMKYWASAAGTSELALRLPSTFASILSIALIYALARDLVKMRGANPDSSPVPFFAALLLALSDIEIDLSHEARMYTLQTALALLTILAYVRWSRRPRAGYAGSIGTTSAVLVYVNYLGVWTPLAVAVHGLVFLRGRQLRTLFASLAAAALTVLPWLLWVGRDQLGNGAGADRADPSTFDTLRVYRDNWFGPQWPLTLGLLALGTVTLDYGSSVRARLRPYRVSALLILWIALPLLLTMIANIWVPVLAAHRISQITPAVCLLIAFGLANFQSPARGFLAVVIVVSALTSVDFYRIKGPWEVYTRTITPFVEPGDLVLMEIGGGDTMLEYYFDRLLPSTTELVSLKRWREGAPDAYYAGILPLLETHQTVWLLFWSSQAEILDWLRETGYVQTMRRETLHIQDSRLLSYRFDRLTGPRLESFGDLQLLDAHIAAEALRVDLFWSAKTRLNEDLVTSAYLLDSQHRLVAQWDSQPMLNERPTSTWRDGQTIYDPKPLQTTDAAPLPPGDYSVGVVVYRFVNGQIERLTTSSGSDSLIIGMLRVDP